MRVVGSVRGACSGAPLFQLLVLAVFAATADGVAGAADPSLSLTKNRDLVFVVGVQYDAVGDVMDILSQHSEVSILSGTKKSKDDGQHVQTVFKTAHQLGGMLSFPLHKEAHMTEESPLLTPANRRKLAAGWQRFWQLDRRFLAVQSPRFATMTRYLQAMFGADRTKFVVVMQHPLHAWHSVLHMHWQQAALSCAKPFVQQWLHIHSTLRKDMRHLKHVHVVRFEDLLPASQLPAMPPPRSDTADAHAGRGTGSAPNGGSSHALGGKARGDHEDLSLTSWSEPPRASRQVFASIASQKERQRKAVKRLFHFLGVTGSVDADIAVTGTVRDSALLLHRYHELRQARPAWFDRSGALAVAPEEAFGLLPAGFRPTHDESHAPRAVQQTMQEDEGIEDVRDIFGEWEEAEAVANRDTPHDDGNGNGDAPRRRRRRRRLLGKGGAGEAETGEGATAAEAAAGRERRAPKLGGTQDEATKVAISLPAHRRGGAIAEEDPAAWLEDWRQVVDFHSPTCAPIVEALEAKLQSFGYMLLPPAHAED